MNTNDQHHPATTHSKDHSDLPSTPSSPRLEQGHAPQQQRSPYSNELAAAQARLM